MISVKAYKIGDSGVTVAPAKRGRDWFSPHSHHCKPLLIANEFGYDVISKEEIRGAWDGEQSKSAVSVSGCQAESQFGMGTFTVPLGAVWETPKGVSTLVGPPPNILPGQALSMSAVIETDILKYPWFLTMKILAPGKFVVPKGTVLARVMFLQVDDSSITISPQPDDVLDHHTEMAKERRAAGGEPTHRYRNMMNRPKVTSRVTSLDKEVVHIVDGFLDPLECQQFRNLKRGNAQNKGDHSFWFGRIWWPSVGGYDGIKDKLDSVQKLISDRFEPVKSPEAWQLVHWPRGMEMPLHDDHGGKKEFPHRDYSAVIYLNDSYTGGETFFSDGSDVSPRMGRLVIFKGGTEKHGVRKVENGDRWTSVTWFSIV